MMLQSHERDDEGQRLLRFFPALPPYWKEGKITGLKARGNITADLEWSPKQLFVTLVAENDCRINIKIGNCKIEKMHLPAKQKITVAADRLPAIAK